ncbi:MAG TPA: EAL domain-containing protein, partial [Acidiphilium sp.]|nr:EAL domain-containing protein [Acidiphilium sp.]
MWTTAPHPSPDAPPDPELERLIERDRASLLYSMGSSSVFVTIAVSAMLIVVVRTPDVAIGLYEWFAGILLVSAARFVDIFILFPRLRRQPFDGRRMIRRFGIGTMTLALLLGSFSWLFFWRLPPLSEAYAFMVFFAMAGGSVTVLSASFRLIMGYCSAVMLPGVAFVLFVRPDDGGKFAIFGIFGFLASFSFARRTSRTVLNGLRLTRWNQVLTLRSEQERQTLERVRLDLADANATLERRVAERTSELAHEVAERERYAEALRRLASNDPLTGLYNRSTFNGRLAAMIEGAPQSPARVALLFVDLDNFKQINDLRGHEIGDQVLRRTAARVADAVGGMGDVARWGGDEFLVALPDCDGDTALRLAEKLIDAIRPPITVGTDICRIEASVGVALYPDNGGSADIVIRAADVAMYAAKREGKSRAKRFDPALAEDMADRYDLEQGLRDAIREDQFRLVFQPIIAARNSACTAFEALLRWTHPVRGPISPATFIPIAEQSGQIQRIGGWVLEQACLAAAAWPDPSIAVTVNISVGHVLVGNLVEDVEHALAVSGLPPARLKIEITETMFLHDAERFAQLFDSLRRQGIGILLDDFGTGFSSLSFLGNLPIDVIKIDQSFVRDAGRNGYATIEAILSIARALGLQVTAEGVETAEQNSHLIDLGVGSLQGYLYSRPMPE